jgi:nitrite reductase/ring-hydroxylating ferredoxin subunit
MYSSLKRSGNSALHITSTRFDEPMCLSLVGVSLIIMRGDDGGIRAFINSCRHRGMLVCRVEEGNAKFFRCPYHGWTYDLEGKLTGVPDYRKAYHGDLKREEWPLLRAPKVRLMNFPTAEAFTRIFPNLVRLILPQGVVDVEANIPPNDVSLIATTSSVLVVAIFIGLYVISAMPRFWRKDLPLIWIGALTIVGVLTAIALPPLGVLKSANCISASPV